MRFYRFILWVFVIAVLCFTPGNEIREIKINIPFLDKIVHGIMFYVLALLLRGVPELNRRSFFLLLFVIIIYAASIEVIQHYYIYLRSGDINDFIADIIGIFLGLFTYKLYPSWIKGFLR